MHKNVVGSFTRIGIWKADNLKSGIPNNFAFHDYEFHFYRGLKI